MNPCGWPKLQCGIKNYSKILEVGAIQQFRPCCQILSKHLTNSFNVSCHANKIITYVTLNKKKIQIYKNKNFKLFIYLFILMKGVGGGVGVANARPV